MDMFRYGIWKVSHIFQHNAMEVTLEAVGCPCGTQTHRPSEAGQTGILGLWLVTPDVGCSEDTYNVTSGATVSSSGTNLHCPVPDKCWKVRMHDGDLSKVKQLLPTTVNGWETCLCTNKILAGSPRAPVPSQTLAWLHRATDPGHPSPEHPSWRYSSPGHPFTGHPSLGHLSSSILYLYQIGMSGMLVCELTTGEVHSATPCIAAKHKLCKHVSHTFILLWQNRPWDRFFLPERGHGDVCFHPNPQRTPLLKGTLSVSRWPVHSRRLGHAASNRL